MSCEKLPGIGAIVCYTKCWACQFGDHFDPPKPHPWADIDDIEHARNTGQAEPTGVCACSCAKTPVDAAS